MSLKGLVLFVVCLSFSRVNDGRLVLDKVSDPSFAGSVCMFTCLLMYVNIASGLLWYDAVDTWERCGLQVGFPFSFWTPVRSSRRWVGRLILTLQTLDAVHVDVDNFNVVKYVGRLLDATDEFRPVELEHEGDPRILCDKRLIVSFLMSVSRCSGAVSFCLISYVL